MGLAGTWAILNVANAFAAREASSDSRSHKQCGDDLIALFTEEEEHRYRTTLTHELHLRYNLKKSYVGRSGRFCENYVRIDLVDDQQVWARCEPSPKIAEIVGARELNGFSDNPVSMVPGLSKLAKAQDPRVARYARDTLFRMEKLLGLQPNLPLSLGGSGRTSKRVSEAQLNALFYFIRTGSPMRLTGSLPLPVKKKLESIAPLGKTSGSITVKDMRTHRLIQVARQMRLSAGETLQADSVPKSTVRRQALNRIKRREGPPQIHPSFLRVARKRLRNIQTLRNRLQQDPRKFRKVGQQLPDLLREHYLPKKVAYALLEGDWGNNTTQDGTFKRILGLDPPTVHNTAE